ncbi:hypothetical protein [Methylomonas sp. HYX-M1]|uniref:hypothetical protein n=1 Tax=Methylomonas sp. HYX-M1 TaxID=3139307 RepID=UPI00345B5A3E
MKVNIEFEWVSKFEITKRQLNRAILLFLHEKYYIYATTLAGANEEILGELVRLNGDKSYIDIYMKNIDQVKQENQPKNEYIKRNLLNYLRNKYKHSNDNSDKDPPVSQNIAEEYINRAIYNYQLLDNAQNSFIQKYKNPRKALGSRSSDYSLPIAPNN